MKLSDLIQRNNWVKVETTFRKLYQLDEEVVNAHREVFEKLLQLAEQTSDLQLEIRYIKDDDEERMKNTMSLDEMLKKFGIDE